MIVKELQGKKLKMTDESLLTPTPGPASRLIRGIPPTRVSATTWAGTPGSAIACAYGNKHHSQHHYLYMCVYAS
jgi:hypothetical protein